MNIFELDFEKYMNETNDKKLVLKSEPGCEFCNRVKIIATDVKEHNYRGYKFYSFTPINPIIPGHTLVVPQIHVKDASENPDITGLTFGIASIIAKKRFKEYNLITNCGKHADQTVFHLHIHIVPRFLDDQTITLWKNYHKKKNKT